MVVGALFGAVIGIFWNDPYRNFLGQYTTRANGFGSWIFQAVTGAIIGAMLTPIVVGLIASNPGVGIAIGLGGIYLIYRIFIDPR